MGSGRAAGMGREWGRRGRAVMARVGLAMWRGERARNGGPGWLFFGAVQRSAKAGIGVRDSESGACALLARSSRMG